MSMKWIGVLACGLSLAACSSGSGGSGDLMSPKAIALDSANGRLVVLDEGDPALSVVDAATNDVVLGRALIDLDHEEDLFPFLTGAPLDLLVTPSPQDATVTRAFVLGGVREGGETTGATLLNRVSVFDIAGSTVSIPDFSPITVEDGDDATDDASNVLSALAVDATNNRLFVLNRDLAELFIYSTADGTEDAASPIAIGGTPVSLAMDPDLRRLFVGNVSTVVGEQQVMTINLDDLGDTSAIAFDFPVRDLGVATNDNGSVLIAISDATAELGIFTLDTATFDAVTAIGEGSVGASEETSDTSDDSSEQTLITASLSQIAVVRAADGQVFAYASQSDGNVFVVDVLADLSAFSTFALETGNELQEGIVPLFDTATGDAAQIYTASVYDGLVIYADVGETETFHRIR